MTKKNEPTEKKAPKKLINPFAITEGSMRDQYASQRAILEVAAIAAKQLQQEEIFSRYIPTIPGSRPTAAQQEIINDFFGRAFRHAYVLGGNQSGKTQLMCYMAAHCFLEILPQFKRRPEWGNEPLLILFLSQNSKQIEDSIVRKMRPYFIDADIREIRIGGALQRIVNRKNGNSIVFFTYHNINECRAAVQSFTAHYVFLDELPSSAALIEEAQTRLVKNEGQFVAAFTPKIPVPEVKRLIELAPPEITKWYKLSFLDNPSVSQESKEAQIKNAMAHGAAKARTILYGDWAPDSNSVFFIDDEKIFKSSPPVFSDAFIGLDPANTSGFGIVVVLYDAANHYYVVDYANVLRGDAIKCNTDAVAWLKQHLLMKYPRIMKIVVDPAAAGFKHELRKSTGFSSYSPAKTHDFFWKSIEVVQNMLHRTLFLNQRGAQELYDELLSYTRSESNPETVANRRRYHLIDALRYLAPYLPAVHPSATSSTPSMDPQMAVINLLREDEPEKKKSALQRIRMNNTFLKFS